MRLGLRWVNRLMCQKYQKYETVLAERGSVKKWIIYKSFQIAKGLKISRGIKRSTRKVVLFINDRGLHKAKIHILVKYENKMSQEFTGVGLCNPQRFRLNLLEKILPSTETGIKPIHRCNLGKWNNSLLIYTGESGGKQAIEWNTDKFMEQSAKEYLLDKRLPSGKCQLPWHLETIWLPVLLSYDLHALCCFSQCSHILSCQCFSSEKALNSDWMAETQQPPCIIHCFCSPLLAARSLWTFLPPECIFGFQ